jgi:HAD superfamily hydrolase (TIGR01509 family)
MLETAIFDLDGVIVDSHSVHRQAWRELFVSLSLPVTEQELDFVLDGHKRDEILCFFLGEHLSPSELRHYGSQKDMKFAQCAGNMQLIEGVREFILRLEKSGVRLAVASSASRERVEASLARFDLKHNFAAVATGDDVSRGKPDPEIFQIACRRLGGDPTATLVIEDAVSGVRGARAAGMQCLGIADRNRAHLLYEAGAHSVVPNFVGLEADVVSELFNRALEFGPGHPPARVPPPMISQR